MLEPRNMTALEFANAYFTSPLGVPDLYHFQGGDPLNIGDKPDNTTRDFAAGGDQPMSCPEMARIGQV